MEENTPTTTTPTTTTTFTKVTKEKEKGRPEDRPLEEIPGKEGEKTLCTQHQKNPLESVSTDKAIPAATATTITTTTTPETAKISSEEEGKGGEEGKKKEGKGQRQKQKSNAASSSEQGCGCECSAVFMLDKDKWIKMLEVDIGETIRNARNARKRKLEWTITRPSSSSDTKVHFYGQKKKRAADEEDEFQAEKNEIFRLIKVLDDREMGDGKLMKHIENIKEDFKGLLYTMWGEIDKY